MCIRDRPRTLRVGHRLLRGEGLAGDDKERLVGLQVVHRLGEIRAVGALCQPGAAGGAVRSGRRCRERRNP